jgi:hypothetical protein
MHVPQVTSEAGSGPTNVEGQTVSLVDLFKRPSDDDGDLPQPLSDSDLLAWSAELANLPEADDPTSLPRRRTPLRAAPAQPRRRRPLVAE